MLRILTFGLVCSACIATSCIAQKVDIAQLKALKIRNIGPAGMSGRVTAIDVNLRSPDAIFVGTASGGVWRSTSGGIAWEPVFDKEPCQAIGAIAINQQNPAEIWVGTGEGNPRNSHNSGLGIFKSIDGGNTWRQSGLSESKVIHRIRIDPQNPEVVYVAALGSAWGPNRERGVFKTTDGGKTWRNILFVNDSTGCAELIMDPTNPRKLIAAMWQYGRKPWLFTSGGKGSGLWMTYDGGETWTPLTSKEGLPEGELGRIGLAIAPSKPQIVYALVEAKENALYRSTDGGHKWSRISTDENIGNRPFYYAEIYVDPQNENRVFSLWTNLSVSEDGGRTFQQMRGSIHPDHHALWIHPTDGSYLLEGNDGGLNISHDGGKTWRFAENLPVGQFYHVNYDMQVPYRVGGGLQDNGTWIGPSTVWQSGGIRNHHWQEVLFGDGFDVVFQPGTDRYLYAMSQGGSVARIDLLTGANHSIRPLHPDGIDLRFHWNAAIAQDPFRDCGLFFGSQYLHRSYDCGRSWSIISPDLTTADSVRISLSLKSGGLTPDVTTAENYAAILAIAPSPLDSNVIWVGTDDGNLQLTSDGGKSWTNLADRLPDYPEGSWIAQIEVSRHQAGEAFAVVNNYRRNDWRPMVFHTTNFGQKWRRIADEKQVIGHVWSVVQDPVVSELLFLGTEFGLWCSIDGGANWSKWPSGDFPSVPTSDLKIHPRDHDLIVGTFGRSIWILDDIRPLREMARTRGKMLEMPFKVFDMPDAFLQNTKPVSSHRYGADAIYSAPSKPGGATLTIWRKPNPPAKTTEGTDEGKRGKDMKTKDEPKDSTARDDKARDPRLKVVVLDLAGDTVRRFSTKVDTGLVRITWPLNRDGIRFPSRREPRGEEDEVPGGAEVLPGTYKLVLTLGNAVDSTMVTVHADPRVPADLAKLRAKDAARKEFYALVTKATKVFNQLRDAKKTIKLVDDAMVNAPDTTRRELSKLSKSLNEQLDTLMNLYLSPEGQKGIQRNPDNLSTYFWRTNGAISDSEGAPSQSAQILMALSRKKAEEIFARVNAFMETQWRPYRQKVEAVQLQLFKDWERLD